MKPAARSLAEGSLALMKLTVADWPSSIGAPGLSVELVSWALGLFGVAIVATITGALVGFVIDFLLKEGQGMGAAGYEGHIVVCGWNPTAKNLIAELQGDDYSVDVVIIADAEKNPAGSGTYFIKGDPTDADASSIPARRSLLFVYSFF